MRWRADTASRSIQETSKERSTCLIGSPTSPAAGIELVLVAGRAVWRDGAATGARPGRAIRLQALVDPGAQA